MNKLCNYFFRHFLDISRCIIFILMFRVKCILNTCLGKQIFEKVKKFAKLTVTYSDYSLRCNLKRSETILGCCRK